MAKVTELPVAVEMEVRSIIWPTVISAFVGGLVGGIIGTLFF